MMHRYFFIYGLVTLFVFICKCGQTNTVDQRPRILTASDSIETDVRSITEPPDYEKHMADLEKRLPHGFYMVLAKPFVVIGDEPGPVVEMRAKKTVKWAVDMLKKDYFSKDPDIIDIWLFKDEKSYYRYAKDLFNDEPTTPYGYFSETAHALVMNISTGSGTLVHEIVHPFMHTNFPACAPWFDEGLASLYEQCQEKNGHIYGLTNWRLKGLQQAIKKDLVPSFKTLTNMNAYVFYNKDKGTNYGQARYLCYYLQEKGLLVKFYHEFHKNKNQDPTGFYTLKKILNEDNMTAFKKKWEEFVLQLSYP